MKARARELVARGDKAFADRYPIMSLWQQLCENFYPMRADYTRNRYMSEEFASYLMTSRPAIAHRDLSNILPALLRPRDRQWMWARTQDERINKDQECRAALDWMSEMQYRAMYDINANMVEALKQCDGDYISVGNGVLTVDVHQDHPGLLLRNWHLKDVAWYEDYKCQLIEIHHKRRDSARDIKKLFPKTENAELEKMLEEDPNKPLDVRRVILPTGDYDLPIKNKERFPWCSITLCVDLDIILEEVPQRRRGYVIPQWAKVSGTQYAYPLAAVYALPDARMLQQITLTMLEAGQKATDPPLIAVTEAINGGVNTGASMITHVDSDYDERTGEALRPMDLRFDGIKFGAEREERIEKTIDNTFYLNQLRFPEVTKEMTAYEANRVYEEFQRNALPLLEPIETKYTGALCSECFDALMHMNYFGPPQSFPRALLGQEIRFEFDTPLKAAAEQQTVFMFEQVLDLAAKAAQVDDTLPMNTDFDAGYRDAQVAMGAARWARPAKEVAALKQRAQEMAQAHSQANQMAHGADAATRVATAAKSAGEASQALQQAGMQ